MRVHLMMGEMRSHGGRACELEDVTDAIFAKDGLLPLT